MSLRLGVIGNHGNAAARRLLLIGMESELSSHASRYTVTCRHCARVVFRDARHLSAIQVTMIEMHLLICRPLAPVERPSDLFTHYRVVEGRPAKIQDGAVTPTD